MVSTPWTWLQPTPHHLSAPTCKQADSGPEDGRVRLPEGGICPRSHSPGDCELHTPWAGQTAHSLLPWGPRGWVHISGKKFTTKILKLFSGLNA